MAVPAFGPVNYTQKVSAGSVTSLTSDAATTTTGNALIAFLVSFGNSIGVSPVSDSGGHTWTAAVPSTGTTKGWVAVFFTNNITGAAAHTVTFSASPSSFLTLIVYEVTGQSLTQFLGQSATSTASGTTHTAGPISASTGGVPELFFGHGALSAGTEGTGTITDQHWRGTRQSAAATGTTEGFVTAFRVVNSGTSDSFTYTTTDAQNETVVIVGFRAADSAAQGLTWAPLSVLVGSGLSLIRAVASGSGSVGTS